MTPRFRRIVTLVVLFGLIGALIISTLANVGA
ncbi:MAG: hypothetical protein RL441_1109 [Actinomycetota bacterium]